MKKILYTGATTPQGSMLLKALTNIGLPIRIFLDKNQQHNLAFKNNDVETFIGDLSCFKDCVDAVQDCQCIIHAGILSDYWPFRSYAIRKTNILGTIYLIRAARFMQLERFIQIDWNPSESKNLQAKEGVQIFPEQQNSAIAAIQYVQQWIREFTFPAVILKADTVSGIRGAFSLFQKHNPMDQLSRQIEMLMENQTSFKPDIQSIGEYKLL